MSHEPTARPILSYDYTVFYVDTEWGSMDVGSTRVAKVFFFFFGRKGKERRERTIFLTLAVACDSICL